MIARGEWKPLRQRGIARAVVWFDQYVAEHMAARSLAPRTREEVRELSREVRTGTNSGNAGLVRTRGAPALVLLEHDTDRDLTGDLRLCVLVAGPASRFLAAGSWSAAGPAGPEGRAQPAGDRCDVHPHGLQVERPVHGVDRVRRRVDVAVRPVPVLTGPARDVSGSCGSVPATASGMSAASETLRVMTQT